MKKYYWLILVLFASPNFAQKDFIRLISLPVNAREIINQKYGEWEYINSSVPYFDSSGVHIAWEYKDIVKGDFDDNQQTDYALLIKLIDSDIGYFIALLKNLDSYSLVEIEQFTANIYDFLLLSPKGTEVYNYETEESIQLPVDGFTLGSEKAGKTYFFNGTKFISFVSAD